jgi:5,10-methylenetetrahydromethanopterin reductase
MVPSNRHPLTNAAAIATLAHIAGRERVFVAVGSGFTARMAMGQRALRWSYVTEYVQTVKGLLRGEAVEWEGALIEMLHRPGFAPPLPLEVPFVIAAAGPKGVAVAGEIGDGVVAAPVPVPGFDWSAVVNFGTVLDDGEDAGSERAIAAAGHGAAMLMHFGVEHDMLDDLVPGLGREWAAAHETVPAERRHLELHRGHLVDVNDIDRPFVSGQLLAQSGLAADRAAWREHLTALEDQGATELVYQPAGPDIPRELETMAEVAR